MSENDILDIESDDQILIPKPETVFLKVSELEEATFLDRQSFIIATGMIRDVAREFLDTNVSYAQQDQEDIEQFAAAVKARCPALSRFEDYWPVQIYTAIWLRKPLKSKLKACPSRRRNRITFMDGIGWTYNSSRSHHRNYSEEISKEPSTRSSSVVSVRATKKRTCARQYIGKPPPPLAEVIVLDSPSEDSSQANAPESTSSVPILTILQGLQIPPEDCPPLARVLESKGIKNAQYLDILARLPDRDKWLSEQLCEGTMTEIQVMVIKAAMDDLRKL